MAKYKEGKILKLPKNVFDAKCGSVIEIKEEEEPFYRVAIYQGKGSFVNTLCEFSESDLEELIKEEADSLRSELKEYGLLRCANTLIHEAQMDADGNIIP